MRWIKASDRLPTYKDANYEGKVVVRRDTRSFGIDEVALFPYAQIDFLLYPPFNSYQVEWLEETESKPGGGEKLVQDEDLKDWYPGECSVCGYRSSSCEWSSHAIADTGDHSDPTCPICGNIGLEEIENVQPKQDQRPYEYIKKLENDNSYLHDKIIDLKYESPSPHSKEAEVVVKNDFKVKLQSVIAVIELTDHKVGLETLKEMTGEISTLSKEQWNRLVNAARAGSLIKIKEIERLEAEVNKLVYALKWCRETLVDKGLWGGNMINIKIDEIIKPYIK